MLKYAGETSSGELHQNEQGAAVGTRKDTQQDTPLQTPKVICNLTEICGRGSEIQGRYRLERDK